MSRFEKIKEGVMVLVALCALIVTLLIMAGPINNVELPHNVNLVYNNNEEIELPRFESKEELVKILKKKMKDEKRDFLIYETIEDMAAVSTNTAKGESMPEADSVQNSADYSETNVQVQGVDEADIVKTNGDFIYYLNYNVLNIFSTKTGKIEHVKSIELNSLEENEYVNGYDLYLDENYLVIIANSYLEDNQKEEKSNRIMPIYNGRSITKAYIFDLKNYEVQRKIELEGSYVSSRKIDDNIYLITNKYAYRYRNFDEDTILPICKDTAVTNEYKEIPATDIMYFPGFEEDEECTYMIIASFSLNNIEEKATIETYIGSGTEIYCSKENLYVTKTKREYKEIGNIIRFDGSEKTTTIIRKFSIDYGEIKYIATGEVEGTLLNQFSMDEYDGHFRITTTKGNTWDDSSENNLYVLDEKLNIVGKLEGLAKGEKIYSTRFMGEKAYVVTYKTVDPLFVIDLKEPTNPTVLGELKIPGYSSYLHPIDENHLIGFGQDSVEKMYTDWEGNSQVTAYENGLKMAIFDVSDYNNPKELYSIKIGGRGSYSELLYNHKALLYDAERKIFAFTANLMDDAGYYEDGTPKYGKEMFRGALVYNVDIEEGITLRGKIEHEEDKRGIERIIRIGEKLYTLSPKMLKVSDIDTIGEVDKIEF